MVIFCVEKDPTVGIVMVGISGNRQNGFYPCYLITIKLIIHVITIMPFSSCVLCVCMCDKEKGQKRTNPMWWLYFNTYMHLISSLLAATVLFPSKPGNFFHFLTQSRMPAGPSAFLSIRNLQFS